MKEVQKDPVRAKRLDEVYKHLFAHFGITSQKQFAEVLGVQRTGLSSAFNGNVANLTDNLFKKICAAFPGVFNLDYLLTGDGELLAADLGKSNPHQSAPPVIDPSSMVNAIIAAHNEALAAKDELIAAKDETITSLKRELSNKDELIISLRQQLLQLQQLQRKQSSISSFPYPTGVADDKKV